MILQDHTSSLYFAASIGISKFHEPKVIELLDILRGLQFCLMRCIVCLIIESDCQLMVQECNGDSSLTSRLGILMEEIRKLNAHFGSCDITNTPREFNVVAYTLAHHAWHVKDIVTSEFILDFASVAYWLDCNELPTY